MEVEGVSRKEREKHLKRIENQMSSITHTK